MKNSMKDTSIIKTQKIINFISIITLLFFVYYLSYSQDVSLQDKLKIHISYLASDELEGRLIATPGNIKAKEYIISTFKKIGLEPVNGKYESSFMVNTNLLVGEKSSVAFSKLVERPGLPKEDWKKMTQNWTINTDWHPMRFSENGKVEGEIAFVGYGISAPDQKYDDYANIDVTGKIVIILSDSSEDKAQREIIPNYKESGFRELRYKATNARQHGAIGIIFVKMLSDSSNVYYDFSLDRVSKSAGIIAIQANRTSISKFFPASNNLYPTEMAMQKTKKPNSFIFPNTSVIINIDIQAEQKEVQNVFGLIKGTDPTKSNEYIVLGSHFDHLGWGHFASLYKGKPQIHHGADDNASGVAANLELAQLLKNNPLSRPVIIASFNGEEEGLLGSAAFVKDPPIPLENIVFMLNLDMVGRMKDNKLNVMGVGCSVNFPKMLDSLAQISAFSIAKVTEGFSPSDNSSFYGKNIPAIMLFTGLHGDYHRPSDTYDKINYKDEARVVNYAELILRTVGNAPAKPVFIKTASNPEEDQKMDNPGHGAWFGIVPNFEDNPKGFLISGTSSGSPAQKAGLKENDIITQFGNKQIKNIYDLTYVLREHKPGDKVVVIVLRGDKEIKFNVTLTKK